MDGVIIRKAEISDYPEIAEILRSDLGYDCEDMLVKKKLSMLDDGREAVFAAVLSGKVCGIVHIEKYDLLYFDTLANILGLAVKKDLRRRGIGKALMEKACGWALGMGISSVRLNSGGTRTEAHSFYRSIGFGSEKTQIRFMKKLKENEE